MLGSEMTGQTLQGYLLHAVLPPLAGHAHPLAASLVLQAGLGTGAWEHRGAAKGAKLAGDCQLLPGDSGWQVTLGQ